MVLKELKRQTFSLGMLLALLVGLIMLTVGRYPDIKAYFALGLKFEYDYVRTFETICNGGSNYPNLPSYIFQFPQDEEIEV